jgi:26S proteasome regulatory subunit N9
MTEYIQTAIAAAPALQEPLSQLGDLHARKLWHQLTDALLAFLKDPSHAQQVDYRGLYENFISKFEAKLNPLRLAAVAAAVAKALLPDVDAARTFLQQLAEKRERLGPEAALFIDMEIVMLKLRQGDMTEVEATLKAAKNVLEGLAGADAIVYSSYYKAASEYHKVVGPPEAFYKNALMFLAYTPLESLPVEEQYTLAVDISLAALTGDGVFNFGEVLATPILSVLAQTPHAWLSDLLQVFDAGDVDKFAQLVETHREAYFSQPALVNRQEFVKEKVVLLSLMNLVFETPSHERTIPFTKVAARGRIGVEQVEWLLMRAMSLGLIKGVIEEVAQEVSVSWVQPRVLNQEQVRQLAGRLAGWSGKVAETLGYVEGQTPELFV